MKRFWEAASVRSGPDGFEVLLDGRPMRLPGGPGLRLRSAALAEAVAAEWQVAGGARGGEMGFDAVPLTRLAGTAQERVAADPAASVDALLHFGACDLLCYRAERPEALVAAQAAAWDPLLGWAAGELGARLAVGAGVRFVEQPAGAMAALRRGLGGFGPMGLAGLGGAVPALLPAMRPAWGARGGWGGVGGGGGGVGPGGAGGAGGGGACAGQPGAGAGAGGGAAGRGRGACGGDAGRAVRDRGVGG